MAEDFGFTNEEMNVNENLGYPKAYSKLCRNRGFGPYSHGPPFTFMPYALQEDEVERARGLEQMFPVLDPKAKPTTKPKIFAGLLWKQLSHLGNAGFDPAVIRVDAYGNVLYYHADSASPLAWGIDHWFPCSRGGLTVISNLRILQRQACKRKKNKLEFLVPWWDFQLGISVNQFLSIFASSNSDFRHKAFSYLFSEGEDHELNDSQIVDSHSFPQHFFALKEELGLAPAAIVESRRESALSQVDYNRKPRPMSHALVASRKSKGDFSKENEDPQFDKNPYQAIVMARDSLKQREESAKVKAEIQKIDDEVDEMKLTDEEEKIMIQNLELELIKRRRKAEKCRRLSEAQCSYRTMLEKMIRDTMHQSVMYKEQIRLNQAATNALMARLEAQREICDAAEKELHKKYKQRDELEKEIRHELDQGRKRSRIDDFALEERDGEKPVLYLPGLRPRTHLHKELRMLLDEEQKWCEDGFSENEEQEQEGNGEKPKISADNVTEEEKLEEQENSIEKELERLEIGESKRDYGISLPVLQETETEENEEIRKQRGKGNVEKWLQMLLENSHEGMDPQETNENGPIGTEGIIKQLKMSKVSDSKEEQIQLVQDKNAWSEKEDRIENEAAMNVIQKRNQNYTAGSSCMNEGIGSTSFGGMERREHNKEKKLVRSESARALRGSCNGDGNGDLAASNRFFRSPFKTIKKVVKL